MSENFLYYLGFSYCPGVGPYRFRILMDHYQDVKTAYEAPVDELRSLIGPQTGADFDTFRKKFDPLSELKRIETEGIHVLFIESEDYPLQLRRIPDPPICLYVKGKMYRVDFKNDFFFGVVGTRRPSSYGEYVAKKFSRELSEAGFTIVSGMAKGIDGIAHKAALQAGGKTVAFLGCGVDIIYPYRNKSIYNEIVDEGGLVISEYPPRMAVQKGLFIARNRLISGLSQGLLVVEGTKDSGALSTARHAGIQGKDVFAPPGPINSHLSEAPNILLKEGVKPVTSVEDILDEFKMKAEFREKFYPKPVLDEKEDIIFKALNKEPLLVDDLILQSQMPIYELLSILTSLEIKKIVEKNTEGKYQRIAY